MDQEMSISDQSNFPARSTWQLIRLTILAPFPILHSIQQHVAQQSTQIWRHIHSSILSIFHPMKKHVAQIRMLCVRIGPKHWISQIGSDQFDQHLLIKLNREVPNNKGNVGTQGQNNGHVTAEAAGNKGHPTTIPNAPSKRGNNIQQSCNLRERMASFRSKSSGTTLS